MIEILVVIWLSMNVSKKAKEKGRPGTWGLLVAGLWFGMEFLIGAIGGLILASTGNEDSALCLYPIAILGGVAGGFIAHMIVRNLEPLAGYVPSVPTVPIAPTAQAVPAPPAAPSFAPPPPAPVPRSAGYCSKCDANVWLLRDGTCENGHGPEFVSGVYQP